eukprot:7729611-Alexandrium_andersonii.AAC.1
MPEPLIKDEAGPEVLHEGVRRDKAAARGRHASQAAGASAGGQEVALGLRQGGPQRRREASRESQAALGVREGVEPARSGLE